MIKRGFDLLVSITGLILLSPLFLIVAVLIKLESAGPIFYKGDRIGKDGVPFKIFKFRTMVINADQMGAALTHGGDPRVTRAGRFLRKWKIDELPQLINVVRGEMSLVGPRPESPGYVAHYTQEQRRVLEVKPGITGLTQVKFRHEEVLLSRCADPEKDYIEKIMPHKLAIDLEYIEDRSFPTDLKLILDTFLCLFAEEEPLQPQEGL
jgi:lipopolysaccharide/colanic/teichoic acid biosynthesis glycosyltransferase